MNKPAVQPPLRRVLYHHRTQGKAVEGVHIRGITDALRAEGVTVDIISLPGADPYASPKVLSPTKQARPWMKWVTSLPEPLFELAPGNMPRWSQIRLTGLFADEIALLAALAQLPEPLPAYQISTLADEPWERSWMARFQPIRCGERLWICPSWHQVDEPGAVVLQLDWKFGF